MVIVGFDPSNINLGVCAGISGPGSFLVLTATTFKIDSLLNKVGLVGASELTQNDARNTLLNDIIRYVLNEYDPYHVGLEEPFFNGQNPDSLKVQAKALGVIENAIVRHWQKRMEQPGLTRYPPNAIKAAAGVPKEEYSDKQGVTRALTRLVDAGTLKYTTDLHLPKFVDDHTNDAVAIAWTKHLEVQRVVAN